MYHSYACLSNVKLLPNLYNKINFTFSEGAQGADASSTNEPLLSSDKDKREKDTPPPYMP